MTGYEVPVSIEKEIEEFKSLIESFKEGRINARELKARRVPFGVYEQRIDGTYMVRIRCAGGVITPSQLESVGKIAQKYGTGRIHITTRQELQLHYADMDNLVDIMNDLLSCGLVTRGGGGNTVRNISCDDDAGINKTEVFDVTPYVMELTSRLISEPDSWVMPRKYKIAFSGSSDDASYAFVNDLGFIAKIHNGKKGFKVFVAGGMGAKPETGKVLFDFIEDGEVYTIAEAVKSLFNKYGNRKNKHAARIRFLWNKLGKKEFLEKFNEEYDTVKRSDKKAFHINGIVNADESGINPEKPVDNEIFGKWKKRNVREQKQDGLFSIFFPVESGLIDGTLMEKTGLFLKFFGENVVRLTKEQNMLLRNIREELLPNVFNFFHVNFKNMERPVIIDRIIACTGADTCKLGICFAQKLQVTRLIPVLIKSRLDLDKLADLKINISGCPNSCGQHHIADIGFYGKASRKGDRLYPAYNVMTGAKRDGDGQTFSRVIGEVSAYKLPEFLIDVLGAFSASQEKSFYEFVEGEGKESLLKILASYGDVPDFTEDKNYYYDVGSDEVFSIASRSAGECSAGLFDLIETDIENIKHAKDEYEKAVDGDAKLKIIKSVILYSSRMLLITRGVEAGTDIGVYENFIRLFVDEHLVAGEYKALILSAMNNDDLYVSKNSTQAFGLATDVMRLYESMDDTLQFNTVMNKLEEVPADKKTFKDLRNVACPMNFVKTKMELSKLKKGDLLEIYLDEGEPINNVPGSVKSEGHVIEEIKKIGEYYSVLIRKN